MTKKLKKNDYGDGCYVHPHCLTCPLPVCIFDTVDGGRSMLKELRDQELLDAYRKEGLDIAALAQRFALSPRSVYRVIWEGGSTIG